MAEEANNSAKLEEEESLVPPYGNLAWYVKFLDRVQKKDFDRFDREIIAINIIGGDNAKRLFNGLRFLGLVEKDGTVTKDFKSLKRFGDEFKQNLKNIVDKAYSLLFEKVVLETANNETLLNFWAQYYSFGEISGNRATKVFVYLCQRSGISLPQDLNKTSHKNNPIVSNSRARITVASGRKTDKKSSNAYKNKKDKVPEKLEGMHLISWGDTIRIFLKETGDKEEKLKITNQAKKLIDMYLDE